jgi:hypothetical protein
MYSEFVAKSHMWANTGGQPIRNSTQNIKFWWAKESSGVLCLGFQTPSCYPFLVEQIDFHTTMVQISSRM